MFNGLVPGGGGLTVLELVEKYVSLKIGVRQSTYAGYKTVINLLKKMILAKKNRQSEIIGCESLVDQASEGRWKRL